MPRTTSKFTLSASLAVLCAGVLVAGCGGSSNTPSASSQTSSHAHFVSLAHAADLSAAAGGFRESLTLEETVGSEQITAHADGTYSPDSHQMQMTIDLNIPGLSADLGSNDLHVQMVLSGGVMYMKFPAALASQMPGGKPWVSIDLAQLGQAAHIPGLGALVNSMSSINDPGQYLDFLRATSQDTVRNLGQATIDGVSTTHYHAEINMADLPNVVPAADRPAMQQLIAALQNKVSIPLEPVDVWIDGSQRVRRVEIDVTETVAGKTVTVKTTADISDYGPQPAPSVPSADQTTDLLSMIKHASS